MTTDYRYDVALSFAGPDRPHALALASRLQRAGFRVFFDRFEEMWGQDLSERLHAIYGQHCRRAVVFVSRAYAELPWTNFERRVLVSRALNEEPGFLLPIRVDDTELPGLPGVVAYKDLRTEGADAIADSLCRLLAGATTPVSAPVVLAPSDFLYVVANPHRPLEPAFNLGCLVTNQNDRPRALRHFEAAVTSAGERPIQFQWRGFFSLDSGGTQPAMWGMDERLPVRLQAGESRLLGLCMAAAPLGQTMAWPGGALQVQLLAWADVAPRRAEPDVQCRFAVEIDASAAAQLRPWFDPPAGVKLIFPVAVPLSVRPDQS